MIFPNLAGFLKFSNFCQICHNKEKYHFQVLKSEYITNFNLAPFVTKLYGNLSLQVGVCLIWLIFVRQNIPGNKTPGCD